MKPAARPALAPKVSRLAPPLARQRPARPVETPVVLPRQRILIALWVAVLLLTALSALGQVARLGLGQPTVFGLVDLFYVDLENNVPTWFSSALLLLAALLLGGLAAGAARARDRFARHWSALAAVFLFLSLDEMASLHERTIEPLQRVLGQPPGLLAPTWVILGLFALLLVGLAYARFLLHLAPRERLQVVAAGGLFVLGAIGVEMIAGAMLAAGMEKSAPAYVVSAHIEELLEMAGVVIFIGFLLRRAERNPPLRIGVSP